MGIHTIIGIVTGTIAVKMLIGAALSKGEEKSEWRKITYATALGIVSTISFSAGKEIIEWSNDKFNNGSISNQQQYDSEQYKARVKKMDKRVEIDDVQEGTTRTNKEEIKNEKTKMETKDESGNVKSKSELQQAVYLESEVKNFTQPSTIFVSQLKSALSTEGYSFTENRAQAAFRLKIKATTRHHGTESGLVICYADVAVGLLDIRNDRNVFEDGFSHKGISSTREAAGLKALEDAVPDIVSKMPAWDTINKVNKN